MRRSAGVVCSLTLLLTGCAAKPALPPPSPVATAPPALSAVVVGSRRLAPSDLRAPVLQALSAAPANDPPASTKPGIELVVQTADGRTLSCIAHGTAPPRIGAVVLLPPGPDCLPTMATQAGAHVAAGGAIR